MRTDSRWSFHLSGVFCISKDVQLSKYPFYCPDITMFRKRYFYASGDRSSFASEIDRTSKRYRLNARTELEPRKNRWSRPFRRRRNTGLKPVCLNGNVLPLACLARRFPASSRIPARQRPFETHARKIRHARPWKLEHGGAMRSGAFEHACIRC